MPALDMFFAAWAETDADRRYARITEAVADGFVYSDPRSGTRLQGIDAVSAYVGQFSANAPGWQARVDKSDTINDFARATVMFEGKGPDGTPMAQQGTYFASFDGSGRLTLLAGFKG